MVELARRLGCTPRELLLAAARMIDKPDATPADMLATLRQRSADGGHGAAAANLLLTPASAYALGHVDDALASLWGHVRRSAR